MGSSPIAPTKIMKTITTLLILGTALANASPLESSKIQNNLLSLFKSQTKERRQVGYKAVRDKFKSGELNAGDRRLYRVLIGKAEAYHLVELKARVAAVTKTSPLHAGKIRVDNHSGQAEGPGIFKSFNRFYSQWYASALETKDMSKLDWRKPQHEWAGSFQEMEKEIKKCSESFDRLTSSWERIKSGGDYHALYETCEAINECREETAWCDGEEVFERLELSRVITSIPSGASLKTSLQRIDSFNMMIESYTTAGAFNKKQTWASEEAKSMVKILNERRLRLGFECLKLDEVLSNVCKEHSQDMVTRQFFSHSGSDGKDHRARTRDVGWYGSAFGEVLYSGSTVPRDVHIAWWKSEDNRPKLYAQHLNKIGVGIVNKTWTVIIGRTYERKTRFRIAE